MAIWAKVFSRVTWHNKPSTATPINETNLNKSDYALDVVDDRVLELNSRLNNIEPFIPELADAVDKAHKWAQWTDGTEPTATNNSKHWADVAAQLIQGGIPEGTTVSFYVQNGHLYVQQTIDGQQQTPVDLGQMQGAAIQSFPTVSAMNTAVAGGSVPVGSLCCVQQNLIMADYTNY